jgi:hypothetical protein
MNQHGFRVETPLLMVLTPGLSLDKYWQSFDVANDDVDFIVNYMLEREVPLLPDEMAEALIEKRLARLEKEALQAAGPDTQVYLPAETYEKGQRLLFPVLDSAVGVVTNVRPGENPDLGKFQVIEVEFEDDGGKREFASQLPEHDLNKPPEAQGDEDDVMSVAYVTQHFGDLIIKRIQSHLEKLDDIVRIAGRWFPRVLLADINVGHLNLAEAVLDVNEGGPLPTADLLEHIELPDHIDPLLAEFSLDYALQEDDRFDEVGPAGEVMWFLRRLEPPEVQFVPPRLEYEPISVDRSRLTEDLLDLERKLDDELSPIDPQIKELDEVTISLLFPHWRVGALPLSARLQPLFPTAYEAPVVRFTLVDGQTGDSFPGWVVRKEGYVFGLDEWFTQNKVPAGGLVTVRRSDDPGVVQVDVVDRRVRNDWVRTVSLIDDGQIGFTMLKQPIGTAYDDLMVVGLIDAIALDEAWLKGGQRKMPHDRLVSYVFRELTRLNPQGTVHAQSLYSGVNVIQRMSPEAVFAELVTQPYYEHVGDLYWRFEPSKWKAT